MIVVKIGGTSGVNFDLVTEDLAALVKAGQKLVVVHGGSGETNAISEQLGHPPQFVTSPSGYTSRYTNRATLEIFRHDWTLDSSEAERDLGYRQQDLAEGIGEMLKRGPTNRT